MSHNLHLWKWNNLSSILNGITINLTRHIPLFFSSYYKCFCICVWVCVQVFICIFLQHSPAAINSPGLASLSLLFCSSSSSNKVWWMLSSGWEGFRLKGLGWLSDSVPWLRGSSTFGKSGGGMLGSCWVPPFIYDSVEKAVVVDSEGDSFFSKGTTRWYRMISNTNINQYILFYVWY